MSGSLKVEEVGGGSVESGGLAGGRSNLKEEAATTSLKQESSSPHRSASPDSSCPICLDSISNGAFIQPCLHKFCFQCLYNWSKVKPECPLCKTRYSFILHNVRSLTDYEEMPVPWPPTSPLGHEAPSMSSNFGESNFFISVAFQRPRFSYRTTNGNFVTPSWRLDASVLDEPSQQVVPTTPPVGMTVASDWRRRRQASAVELRRFIYRHSRWVQPARNQLRVRDSSPSFYRQNPAQLHRLVPWLNRELNVLLDVRYDSQQVCASILSALPIMHIKSWNFHELMWPYLGERTQHFCHEFYHFAISPYDMLSYDLHCEYTRVSPALDFIESDIDYDDVMVVETTPNAPIEISDTDGEDVIALGEDDRDSDASVVIIGTLPPLSQRVPQEVISLDDTEDETVDVNENHSPKETKAGVQEEVRLRSSISRPYYKDESSSSSDEEVEVRRARPKRRRKWSERKRRRVSSSSADSKLSQSPPPPKLKSVVKKVNRDGPGCSTWHSNSLTSSSSTSDEAPQHNLRPRKHKLLMWVNYSSSSDD